MTEVVRKVVFTLSAPAGHRGSGGLGGTSSITLYETESIHMKQHIWGQHNSLNVNETLSYHRLASSSGGLFGASGFSTAISITMYDLESAYIWDDKKSLGKKTLPRVIPYFTASFEYVIDRWTDLALRVHLRLQSRHAVSLNTFSLGIRL